MRVRITKDPRLSAFRKHMGPSGNGITDRGLKKLAGWPTFCAGWKAHEKHLVPIKAESLVQRTIAG